jgi:hypothetical protein
MKSISETDNELMVNKSPVSIEDRLWGGQLGFTFQQGSDGSSPLCHNIQTDYGVHLASNSMYNGGSHTRSKTVGP